jgi:hypothetical protein
VNILVQQRIQAIADLHDGRITPELVVDAARDPDSPLHEFFTWDNDEAAEKHRLNEARSLIRSIRVDVKISNMVISAPYYIRDPEAKRDEQGYLTAPVLRKSEDLAREAVVAAFQRASRVLSGARDVAAALGMSNEIDDMVDRILSLSARVEDNNRRAKRA